MIVRQKKLAAIRQALEYNPVVVLAGPRQSGKTTLARTLLSPDSSNYFDLEDPLSCTRLNNPMTALRPLTGLVVIDEVQRCPEIFPVLRVLADRHPCPAQFLVLGSASGTLLRQSSESLAGRMEQLKIGGFQLDELNADAEQSLWLRGGFPRSYLAHGETRSLNWRKQFMQTLLERDFPQWGIRISATALHRFWSMLAHYHAQLWNAAELARALGTRETTVRHYLDLLSDALMIRQLLPYHANVRKRQVKAPKIYLRDSGLLHQILGIRNLQMLFNHPKIGASWEGFVIEQVLAHESYEAVYFWSTHQGAEIDLLLQQDGIFVGIECKRCDSPRMTPSIRHALVDLELDRVMILYPGEKRFDLHEKVSAVPVHTLATAQSLLED